jgi:hypothetical protein
MPFQPARTSVADWFLRSSACVGHRGRERQPGCKGWRQSARLLLIAKLDTPADFHRWAATHQSHDGEAGDRLAGTRLAYRRRRLAAANRE